MSVNEIEGKKKRIEDSQKNFDKKYSELAHVYNSIENYKKVIESKRSEYDKLRTDKQSISDEINQQEAGLNTIYHVNFILKKLIILYQNKLNSVNDWARSESWKVILGVF